MTHDGTVKKQMNNNQSERFESWFNIIKSSYIKRNGVNTMDSIKTALFKKLMHDKNYAEISRMGEVLHNRELVITEYDGSEPRLFKRDDETHLLCPHDIDMVMESGIARAIETGEIFDDADSVDRHADFIQKTMLPLNAMANSNVDEPKKMKIVIASVIGRMNPDGHVELSSNDMERGADVVKDMMHHHHHHDFGGNNIGDICSKHIGCHDHMHMPIDIRRDMFSLSKEIDSIADIDDLEESELEPSDIDFDDVKTKDEGMEEQRDNSIDDDDEDESESSESDDNNTDNEEHVQEGVTLLKQPKRLKAIGREIINYIPSQIMQIQDSHDQMVLVGYVSSQLEKVDFYLNCLDTDDGRYVVPHNKEYLLSLQKELTDLLQRILRLNPVVKYERIWKPGIR